MGGSEIFRDDLLAEQVALITGGGTGLGKATARELTACGARVVICGRREEVLRETAAELGEGCSFVAGDIRECDQAQRIVSSVLERHGRIDLLVNNAGGQYFTPAEEIEPKGFHAVLRLNLAATKQMCELVYERALLSTGGGTIVNVTLSPHHGLTGMTHSSAARAAVEGLTAELAERWRDDGVTVIAAAAGHFETEVLQKYPETVWQGLRRAVPLQRLGRPQEHGWLVALMTSPLGRSLSGTTVTLDGARDNWFGPWPPPDLLDDAGEVPVEERPKNLSG